MNVAVTPQARHYSDPMPQTPNNYMGGYNQVPRNGSWPGSAQHHGSSRGYGNTRVFRASVPRSPQQFIDEAGHPNDVYIHRILSGQDVRTTLMLRNIPNAWTFRELKELVDETSFGKYDYSYLRIDFNNNLTVGYGFVNFTDPVHIVEFMRRHNGRRWEATNTRRCSVSYAVLQGLDCLIEKMRNSSVMTECPDFRPKMWWTDETAPMQSMIGKEREFPSVNNDAKHQRSLDNAGQVGLYASGSRRNRGYRARQSQYDRGTPAQIQEDYFNNQEWLTPTLNCYGFDYTGSNGMYVNGPMSMDPPPVFAPMGINPFGNAYTNGHVAPPAYGIPFTDPFNDGYGITPPHQGRFPSNGGRQRNGRGRYGSNGAAANQAFGPGYHFQNGGFQGYPYQNGNNGNHIPRIVEEDAEYNVPDNTAAFLSHQFANSNGGYADKGLGYADNAHY